MPQSTTPRSSLGIPEGAVVLATASPELDRALSDSFIDCVVSILRANPNAIFMATGDGELSAAKRRFESAGVSRRVGWAPRRKDVASFLRIADVYLAEFPMLPGMSGTSGILSAMSVGCPVIAMKGSEGGPSPASMIGEEACVDSHDTSAFSSRVNEMIRNPAMRSSTGKAMQSRAVQQFGFAQTVRQLEEAWNSLLREHKTMRMPTPLSQSDEVLVQVA